MHIAIVFVNGIIINFYAICMAYLYSMIDAVSQLNINNLPY